MSYHASAFRAFRRVSPTLLAMSLAATGAFTACSDNGPTTVTVAQVTGVRPMRTANNQNIPTTFTDGSGKKLTIESGSLKIKADDKYLLAYEGHLGTLDFDLDDEGVVKVSGNTLTFTPEDAAANRELFETLNAKRDQFYEKPRRVAASARALFATPSVFRRPSTDIRDGRLA